MDNSYGINSAPVYSVTNPSDPFSSYYGMYEDYTGGENGLKAFLYPTDEDRKVRDPLIFAKDLDLSGLQVYLDCGDQDENGFYEGAQQMYAL